MEQIIEGTAKIVALILALFALVKAMTAGMVTRLVKLEAATPRTTAECDRLMANCPIHIYITNLQEQIRCSTEWQIRLDKKLDDLFKAVMSMDDKR